MHPPRAPCPQYFSLLPRQAPSAPPTVPVSALVQNLTNEEQVVVIQARTVLTLAEKVTAPVWPLLGQGRGSRVREQSLEEALLGCGRAVGS